MNLAYRQIRGAPTVYDLTLLIDFYAHHGRTPDDNTTLADWWALPSPLHQRLGVLVAVAAAYPEYAPTIFAAVQQAAATVGVTVPDAAPVAHWHLYANEALDPRRQPPGTQGAAEAILFKLITDLEVTP